MKNHLRAKNKQSKYSKKIISCVLAAALTATVIPFSQLITSADSVPEGFVYTDGTKFMCDGSPYYYGGTNCYYLTFKSKTAVDNVFSDAADMGLKVIRVWGNIDAGTYTGETDSNGYDVFTNNNDGAGHKDGIYFQYFDKTQNKPVVNEGSTGLEKLDYVIYKAEQNNLKVLITFTNYWDAFGGIGQYLKWAEQAGITGLKKDDFYTNDTLKQWYKDYVKTLLNHTNVYTGKKLKDESGVFAWELCNEPRCSSDAYCEDDILYNWAKEMSEYVKSVDSEHMVSVGDEGFFNYDYGSVDGAESNYVWYGAEGSDFDKLISIDTIDFGTPHFYVDSWNLKITNGNTEDDLWLKMHADSAKEANKPVILEEFGLTDKTIRDEKYSQWFDIMAGETYDDVEYAGFNYWMIASYMEDGTLYPDYDQYTVYGTADAVETASTRELIIDATDKMEKKNICNVVTPVYSEFDRRNGDDIELSCSFKIGDFSGISLDDKLLQSGKDYKYSDGKITIYEDYLSSLELSTYNFRVETTGGNEPTFTINVDDSSIEQPELSIYNVTVDKNPKKLSDTEVAMSLNGSEFRGIMYNSEYLTEGADYTVNGNVVTIAKSFLAQLNTEAATLVFDFYEGKDRTLCITVEDTTGEDEIDTFESYLSDSQLNNSYTANTNGNTVSLSLTSKNNSQALAYNYNLGNPDYCGITKSMASRDFSDYDGISLWIEGDSSGNQMTIQLKDGNGNYWESYVNLDFSGSKTIQLPFSNFVSPSWQNTDSVINTSKLTECSIYAGKNGNVTNGTIYLDNIIAYTSDSEIKTPYINNNSQSYDAGNGGDVVTEVTFYNTYLDTISCNSKTLVNGTDYTCSGSTVKINDSWLSQLDNGTYQLAYKFSDATTDVLTLYVSNKTVDETETAQLKKSYAEFDLYKPENVSAEIDFNGKSISSVIINETVLTNGSDYTVNSDSVVVSGSYLADMAVGTYAVTFVFNDLNKAVMTLKITDSTPESNDTIVIDSFDNISSSAYARNVNGNAITISADNNAGKIAYTVGKPDYAGLIKQLNNLDLSSSDRISFVINSDTANRDIVLQFKDTNGYYTECKKRINQGEQTVEILFSEFAAPSWSSQSNFNWSNVAEYSIYMEKGNASDGNGVITIDNMVAGIQQKEEPTKKIENATLISSTNGIALIGWDDVDNCGQYTIKIDNTVIGTTISNVFAVNGLISGQSYTIEIVPSVSTVLSATVSFTA